MKKSAISKRFCLSKVPAVFFLLFCLILCTNFTSAKTYHITLLTVGEGGGSDGVGGTADAYLDIKPGSGRIFLDSFPLTKLDTQISTRYAKEIACDYLDMDCSGKDFFYTIRAGSTIVGGPSASASLTVLTIAALKNLKLDNTTVMTGTINSGGSIGPVGGISQKALAAQRAGFERVLVPLFSINMNISQDNASLNISINSSNTNRTSANNTNQTNKNKSAIRNISIIINTDQNISTIANVSQNTTLLNISLLKNESENLTIQIINVTNIDEALSYFTGKPVQNSEVKITVPDDYTAIMKSVAENLCNRSIKLNQQIKLSKEKEINQSNNFLANINKSFTDEDYYSAASYCFSLGLLLRKASFRDLEKINNQQLRQIHNATKIAVAEFNTNLDEFNITTLSQLETYIIVKERLLESEKSLADMEGNISAEELAYALERYYSAVYWSEFFKMKGKPMKLDTEYLKQACYSKISEAEERINYAALYMPFGIDEADGTLQQAYDLSDQENYKMCLFKASFAKAEANMILSSIAVGVDQAEALANEKLKAASKLIAREESRGFFPIMGYSYYEYANTLVKNDDAILGLVFAEDSLELSNLEIYFQKKKSVLTEIINNINFAEVLIFAAILLLGMGIGVLVASKHFQKQNNFQKQATINQAPRQTKQTSRQTPKQIKKGKFSQRKRRR